MSRLFGKLGPLSVIAAILLLSAALRVLGVSSAAFALNEDGSPTHVEDPKQSIQQEDQELDALLLSFQQREAEIVKEEKRIEARLDTLKQAERAISEQMGKLEQAEARLRELLAIASTAAEDDVARLTSVYENMKPKDAATVFEQMQPGFAAGFLARMRPDSAAAIMAGLSPQAAYAISVTLAGRHTEEGARSR